MLGLFVPKFRTDGRTNDDSVYPASMPLHVKKLHKTGSTDIGLGSELQIAVILVLRKETECRWYSQSMVQANQSHRQCGISPRFGLCHIIIKLKTFLYRIVKEWCTSVHRELRDRGSFAPTLWFVFQSFHKATWQMAPRVQRYSDSTKQRRVNLLVYF